MRGSQDPHPRETVIFYQLKAKFKKFPSDEEHPAFRCRSFDSNKEPLPHETELSGHLIDVNFKTIQYDNHTKRAELLELKLHDPDSKETYLIGAYWSLLTLSLLNQLLNSPFPFQEPVRLSVYTKNDFPAISVTYNKQWAGVRYKWKEDIEPLITHYDDPNSSTGSSKSYHRVNEMMKDEVNKTLLPQVQKNAERLRNSAPEKTETEQLPLDIEDNSDDLPF